MLTLPQTWVPDEQGSQNGRKNPDRSAVRQERFKLLSKGVQRCDRGSPDSEEGDEHKHAPSEKGSGHQGSSAAAMSRAVG